MRGSERSVRKDNGAALIPRGSPGALIEQLNSLTMNIALNEVALYQVESEEERRHKAGILHELHSQPDELLKSVKSFDSDLVALRRRNPIEFTQL